MAENEIYNTYLAIRSSLARVVMRIVPPKEVEDIVQEAYVRVCQIERKGRDIKEPRAFLYKTARNLALDHLKRAETRLAISTEDLSESESREIESLADQTFDEVASDEEFSFFCKAVRELPVQCRRVFVLKKVYGYSQREIARQMSLSENTVEKHIALGIKRCAVYMQQYDEKYQNKESVRKDNMYKLNQAKGRSR